MKSLVLARFALVVLSFSLASTAAFADQNGPEDLVRVRVVNCHNARGMAGGGATLVLRGDRFGELMTGVFTSTVQNHSTVSDIYEVRSSRQGVLEIYTGPFVGGDLKLSVDTTLSPEPGWQQALLLFAGARYEMLCRDQFEDR